MKKFLSLMLVLCMVLANCMIFSSCKDKDEADDKEQSSTNGGESNGDGSNGGSVVIDYENQTVTGVSYAVSNTMNTFFKGNGNIISVLEKCEKNQKASFGAYFESKSLLGDDFGRISFTEYADASAGKAALDVEVNYAGEKLAGTGYFDKNGLAVSGDSILGSNNALSLNYEALINNLATSNFAQLFNIDAETAKQITDVVKEVKDALDSVSGSQQEAANEATEILKLLDLAVTNETVNGAECAVISCKYSNETIKKLLKKISTVLEENLGNIDGVDISDLTSEIDTLCTDLDSEVAIDLTQKVYVVKSNNTVTDITITGTVSNPEDTANDVINVDVKTTFTDKEIKLVATAKYEGRFDAKADFVITKQSDADKTVYTAKFDVASTSEGNSETLNVVNATATHTNAGAITLEADIFTGYMSVEDSNGNYTSEACRSNFKLVGTLKTESDSFTLEFTSVTLDDVTIEFVLGIKIAAIDKVPETPANAKDVLTMTQSDWEDLMQKMMETPFGKLITEMQNEPEEAPKEEIEDSYYYYSNDAYVAGPDDYVLSEVAA